MDDVSMLEKLKRFWREPIPNKVHVLGTLYYKVKGIVFYRRVFKQFGRGSYIRRPLLIWNAAYVRIGKGVSILDGLRMEVLKSSERRIPELTIGDNTNIEQNVHIICHNRVHIGCDVSITGNCSIVDVTHPFGNTGELTKVGSRIQDEDSFVEIGNGSFIGFGSVILPNVRIGKGVVVGANSVVSRDLPDYSVAAGVPAVIVSRIVPGS
jgi:acetyltransferase-like isoleucine patch superfamily enzyme